MGNRFKVTSVDADSITVTDTLGQRGEKGALPEYTYYVDPSEFAVGDWVDLIVRKRVQ